MTLYIENPKETTRKLLEPINKYQSWVFIGRTDVEAENTILWLPDAKSWLTGKDPDARKDWGQEEQGTREDEMIGWHHWLNGHGFGWTPGRLQFMGSQRVRHDWGTELNWINEYSKVAGYKINTQKSLTFLYTNNEKTKREIKGKNLIHHCNEKNKILRNKFT